MKTASTIIGFVLVCIGIAAFAGHAPVLGVHPAVWFILSCGLMLSDSAWEHLARSRKGEIGQDAADEDGEDGQHSPHDLDHRI